MWVYVCVYAHAHKTLHVGYSDVSPGVGTKHLESPKNIDVLNFRIHESVYVCKILIYIYMLGGEMRSWTDCFFLFNIFSLPKKKNKRCEHDTKNSRPHGFELHRPSIKGTQNLGL